jgi:hypothetical protein
MKDEPETDGRLQHRTEGRYWLQNHAHDALQRQIMLCYIRCVPPDDSIGLPHRRLQKACCKLAAMKPHRWCGIELGERLSK